MNPRVLTILNTIGCVILAGWVAFHWFKERRMHENLTYIQSEFIRSEKLAASESERAAALERDIAVLKETVEMTQQAAARSANSLTAATSLTHELRNEIKAGHEQLNTWKSALAERDAKIRSLNAELISTRQRLDAAIAALKAAGAR